jgi:Rrf2 family iron-sulfur cluster assembly transcriptional regulator
MRLSSKGQIAISGMMFLAINGKGRAMTAAQIAADQDISVSYIEQLFANLRESKLIEGVRGPGGGYRLALDAADITVADIVTSVDDRTYNMRETVIPHYGDNVRYLSQSDVDDISQVHAGILQSVQADHFPGFRDAS